MGRSLHYQTWEAVTADEFKLLKQIEAKHNSKRNWGHGEIRLWKKSWIVRDPPLNAIWGYTKVYRNDGDGKAVIRAIKEMSRVTPGLTWVLYDEGGLTGGRKLVIKKGKVAERI